MLVEGIPVRARDSTDGTLEIGVVERLDLPAAPADEMMVMLAARMGGLEAGETFAQVDAAHEP